MTEPKLEPQEIAWIAKLLRKVDLFASLSMKEMDDLINHMQKREYGRGQAIVRQGDRGDAFFIVYKGRVKVVKSKLLVWRSTLGELGPEQFFGEMSLLTDETRMATVSALEETVCFVLLKGFFEGLVRNSPAFQKLVQDARKQRLGRS